MDKTCRQLSLSPAVIAASDVQLQNHMLKQAITVIVGARTEQDVQAIDPKHIIFSVQWMCEMN